MHPDITEFVNHALTLTNLVVINTNGGLRNKEWYTTMGNKYGEELKIVFAIDGIDHETNWKYREGVDFNNKILAELIMRYAPDWRRVINECQRYSSSGEITSDILIGLSDQNIAALVGFLKIKDFKSMRSWVTNNTDIDSSVIFRRIYDTLYDFAQPQSIPAIILILADYQYKVGFVADKELNTVACLTEIMASSEWK